LLRASSWTRWRWLGRSVSEAPLPRPATLVGLSLQAASEGNPRGEPWWTRGAGPVGETHGDRGWFAVARAAIREEAAPAHWSANLRCRGGRRHTSARARSLLHLLASMIFATSRPMRSASATAWWRSPPRSRSGDHRPEVGGAGGRRAARAATGAGARAPWPRWPRRRRRRGPGLAVLAQRPVPFQHRGRRSGPLDLRHQGDVRAASASAHKTQREGLAQPAPVGQPRAACASWPEPTGPLARPLQDPPDAADGGRRSRTAGSCCNYTPFRSVEGVSLDSLGGH
jgi:hypothetical protein